MSRTSYTFKIPSHLNDALQQVAELPLDIATKCVEHGAELLANDVNAQLNDVGDGTEVTISFDPRFGDLAAQLDTLSEHTGRPIEELLPSVFAAGFAAMEPEYLDIVAKRLANAHAGEQSAPAKGKGSSEVN